MNDLLIFVPQGKEGLGIGVMVSVGCVAKFLAKSITAPLVVRFLKSS